MGREMKGGLCCDEVGGWDICNLEDSRGWTRDGDGYECRLRFESFKDGNVEERIV